MPKLMEAPPHTTVEPVTDVLHGVPVTDPYRWLEDQDSPRARQWLAAQTRYARTYLDAIPGRERIRQRVRDLLDVETYDSLQKVGSRYFFRKRLLGQEQPCLCTREGPDGSDEVLIDPAQRGTGPHTAVKLLRVSSDGRLVLYEVKQGGERSGSFEIFDLENRMTLPDHLPRGYLRGFAFSPDSKAFYYVHEAYPSKRARPHAAYRHLLGSNFTEDLEVFSAGEGDNVRLHIIPGAPQLGFLVSHISDEICLDFYSWSPDSDDSPRLLIRDFRYQLGPLLLGNGRILALTNCSARNFRIVEIIRSQDSGPEFRDVVPEGDAPIQNWTIVEGRILVSYFRKLRSEIAIFDLSGKYLGEVPLDEWETVRLLEGVEGADEVFLERESFTRPVQICSNSVANSEVRLWAERHVPFESSKFHHIRTSFHSKDGTEIPISLVGLRDIVATGPHPTLMTSYGGYGVPMSPQFSVFVAFLLERGCLFALPNIRGGSEFGARWHEAARRRNRQVAFDDFLAAAEWLIRTGRSEPRRFAIFGGSNSGLLVGAAMTQHPELFRAVLCMVPILDMLRYHLFDDANLWKDEFGTSEEPLDFSALLKYSPYHNISDNTAYPATMIVSGDSDQKCNPLHARKMTARLQAANTSENIILLDYSPQRGHSPVLPLTDRVEALTDRMAFLCDQLRLLT